MINHLQNAKRPGFLKRNPGPLQNITSSVPFSAPASLQEHVDLFLHAAEPLFVAICERRVICQREFARIPDHTKLLVRKKALFVYQACTGSEVSFCTRIVLYKVVSHTHTIALKIPELLPVK